MKTTLRRTLAPIAATSAVLFGLSGSAQPRPSVEAPGFSTPACPDREYDKPAINRTGDVAGDSIERTASFLLDRLVLACHDRQPGDSYAVGRLGNNAMSLSLRRPVQAPGQGEPGSEGYYEMGVVTGINGNEITPNAITEVTIRETATSGTGAPGFVVFSLRARRSGTVDRPWDVQLTQTDGAGEQRTAGAASNQVSSRTAGVLAHQMFSTANRLSWALPAGQNYPDCQVGVGYQIDTPPPPPALDSLAAIMPCQWRPLDADR